MTEAQGVPAGTVFGGEYEVERPLAAGGMGAVYVARQRSTQRLRALKTMHRQLVSDPTLRSRFAREATVGSQIESDHVVEVLAAGIDDATGLPWIAMELLDGASLADAIKKRGPTPPAELAEVARQLGHALAAAHRAGIVHRDLKPDNIFLATSRRQGAPFMVKVLDFGIAKFLHTRVTNATTSAIGSPLWMAPEQTDTAVPVAPATDVWALGLVMFHALTGRHYWRTPTQPDATVANMLNELLVAPLPPASARAAELGVAEELPPGFDAWFARCVAREQPSRFRDAGEAIPGLLAVLEATAQHASAQPSANYSTAALAATQAAPLPAVPLVGTQALPVTMLPAHTAGALYPPPPPQPVYAAPPARARSRAPWVVAASVLATVLAAGGVWLTGRHAPDAASHSAAQPVEHAPVVAATEPGKPPATATSPTVVAVALTDAAVDPEEPRRLRASRERRSPGDPQPIVPPPAPMPVPILLPPAPTPQPTPPAPQPIVQPPAPTPQPTPPAPQPIVQPPAPTPTPAPTPPPPAPTPTPAPTPPTPAPAPPPAPAPEPTPPPPPHEEPASDEHGRIVTRSTSLRSGQHVLIAWGAASSWYPGVVREVHSDGRVRVHYDGWSDNFDEDVPRSRLRLPN